MALFKKRKATQLLMVGVSHPGYARDFTAEEAERLIADGADPNALMPEANSPLGHICVWGNVPVAQVLLRHGADPNGNRYRRTVPLHVAAQNGYAELVRLLVDHGADVNLRENNGDTALHRALRSGSGQNSEVPEVLVELGIDPAIRNGSGVTALADFKQGVTTLTNAPLFGNQTWAERDVRDRELTTNLQRFTALLDR
jgi:ankyrin repeat protein